MAENKDFYFLRQGGAMGELIRAKDWSKTPIGAPETWPESLCTMIAVMLDNPFPMYIAWGTNYTQIYNDGYRPILGTTKHPAALGIGTRETFSEIWNIIGTMFDGVMQGQPVGFPNFMLPLNRNGFIEECYFDFAYSPIRLKNGEVGGILVTVVETTANKKIETALINSNQRYLNNIIQAPVAMCILRGENLIVEVANEKMLELWDKKIDEVLQKPIFEGLPEAKDQGLESILDHVYRTGERFTANERPVNLPRNGVVQTTYINFVYEALHEEDQKISGIVAIAVEVTEQVLARTKIQASEIRFRNLIAQSPIPMAVFKGPDHLIEMANDAMQKRWRKKEDDYLNIKVTDVFPEIKSQNFIHLLNQAYTSGISYSEHESESFLIFDGIKEKFYVDFEYSPVKDVHGKVSGIIITVNDVTDRVETRKKIEESEKRFRSLAETLPQLIWETDNKGNSLYASGKWFEYTGIKPGGEAEWRAVIHPDDYENNTRVWKHSLLTGEIYRCDLRLRKKNGEYRWYAVTGESVLDQDKNIIKWVGAFTDIQTEKIFRQELEKEIINRTAELELKNDALEKMNKELQSFAYISSHDLQEPLRKIQTFTSQILEKEHQSLSEYGQEKFKRMQNAAKRMQTLIEDLLSYSRTTTAEMRFEKTDLRIIVDDVREDLKDELLQKNAIIEIIEICELTIIPFQFRQLIYNLVSNSLKFTKPNTAPHIKIKCIIAKGIELSQVKLNHHKNYCHISFADNGIGFEEIYSEKIFEVFQRLHGKQEYDGTGIGLAIVKKIVENHNGFITAHGAINKGSTFNIYFPEIPIGENGQVKKYNQ